MWNDRETDLDLLVGLLTTQGSLGSSRAKTEPYQLNKRAKIRLFWAVLRSSKSLSVVLWA